MRNITELFYFILFSKNKNIYFIKYYSNIKNVLAIFIFSAISFSVGKISLSNAGYEITGIAVSIIAGAGFLFILSLIESFFIHISAKMFNNSGDYRCYLKSVLLTYAPLILYSPFSILSVYFSKTILIFLILWIVILKIHMIKINYNSGFLKTLIILFFPAALIISIISLAAVLIGILGFFSGISL